MLKKIVLLSLIALFNAVCAMEQKYTYEPSTEDPIFTLYSNAMNPKKDTGFKAPRSLLMISPVLKCMVNRSFKEGLEQKIYFENFGNDHIKLIIGCLKLINKKDSEKLSIIKSLSKSLGLSDICDYLGIDLSKVCTLSAKNFADKRKRYNSQIQDLKNEIETWPKELQPFVAKHCSYFLLNNENLAKLNKDFSTLDYGFSVKELNDRKQLPKIDADEYYGTSFNLSNMRIEDLEGFESIKGIEEVDTLNLNNNAIKKIPENFFEKLPNLEYLYLANNYLEEEQCKKIEEQLKNKLTSIVLTPQRNNYK